MPWVLLIAGATLAGGAVVSLLVVPRRAEPLAGLGIGLLLSLSVWGLVALIQANPRWELAVASVLIGLASLATGYLLAASFLTQLAPRQRPAPVPRTERADGRAGVVLFAEAEPERYSPRTTAWELLELGEAEAHVAPLGITPFFFASEKARYRSAGDRSPARDTVRAVVRRIAGSLDTDRFAEPVVAYTHGAPSLGEAVSALAREGCGDIVVCTLGVAERRGHELGKRALDAALADSDVAVEYAPPLWTSDALAALVASRVLRACEDVESTTGVALVVHGQPPAWSRDFREGEDQEIAFSHRVRALLVDGGLADTNLRLAWDAWREPDIPEVVRHLAAIGCTRVFVVPACDPVDSLATLFDLTHAADYARVSVPARVMPAWNDAPEVAETVVDAVTRTLRLRAGG